MAVAERRLGEVIQPGTNAHAASHNPALVLPDATPLSRNMATTQWP